MTDEIDQAAASAYTKTESAIRESNEGHSALADFVDRFGEVLEFEALSKTITEFLENEGG